MTVRNICTTIASGLLVCGVAALGADRAYAQVTTSNLPQGNAWTTVVGCLQPGLHKRLVLIRPTVDRVESVAEATCTLTANDGENMLEVHDTHEYHVDQSMVGHWVEVSGRLEHFDKHDDPRNPREFHVRTIRAVPVVIPRASEVEPPRDTPPAYTAAAPPASIEAKETPTATTGTAPTLPKTASPLPVVGLTGLLSLVGGLGLRLFRRRSEA